VIEQFVKALAPWTATATALAEERLRYSSTPPNGHGPRHPAHTASYLLLVITTTCAQATGRPDQLPPLRERS